MNVTAIYYDFSAAIFSLAYTTRFQRAFTLAKHSYYFLGNGTVQICAVFPTFRRTSLRLQGEVIAQYPLSVLTQLTPNSIIRVLCIKCVLIAFVDNLSKSNGSYNYRFISSGLRKWIERILRYKVSGICFKFRTFFTRNILADLSFIPKCI